MQVSFLLFFVPIVCGQPTLDCLADEFCANSIKEQTYTCTLSGKNLNWELDKDGVNVGMKTYNESSAILMVEPIETMSPFTAVLVVNDGSTMESNLTFTPLIDMDGLLIQCYKKMNTSISSCTVIIADVPTSPLNVILSDYTNVSVLLSWSPPNVSANCVNTYTVISDVANMTTASTEVTLTVPEANPPSTKYCAAIVAIDFANRTGSASTETCFILDVPASLNVSYVIVGDTLTVYWISSELSVNRPPITAYYIQVVIIGVMTVSITVEADIDSYTLPNIPNGGIILTITASNSLGKNTGTNVTIDLSSIDMSSTIILSSTSLPDSTSIQLVSISSILSSTGSMPVQTTSTSSISMISSTGSMPAQMTSVPLSMPLTAVPTSSTGSMAVQTTSASSVSMLSSTDSSSTTTTTVSTGSSTSSSSVSTLSQIMIKPTSTMISNTMTDVPLESPSNPQLSDTALPWPVIGGATGALVLVIVIIVFVFTCILGIQIMKKRSKEYDITTLENAVYDKPCIVEDYSTISRPSEPGLPMVAMTTSRQNVPSTTDEPLYDDTVIVKPTEQRTYQEISLLRRETSLTMDPNINLPIPNDPLYDDVETVQQTEQFTYQDPSSIKRLTSSTGAVYTVPQTKAEKKNNKCWKQPVPGGEYADLSFSHGPQHSHHEVHRGAGGESITYAEIFTPHS